MPVMARKKTSPSTEPKQQPQRSGKAVHLWLDEQLVAILDDFVRTNDLSPTKTAVIEAALREYFRAKGYWPPKAVKPE